METKKRNPSTDTFRDKWLQTTPVTSIKRIDIPQQTQKKRTNKAKSGRKSHLTGLISHLWVA